MAIRRNALLRLVITMYTHRNLASLLQQLEGHVNNVTDRMSQRKVPNAPMKNTETWIKLGFKTMLEEAVAKGYDEVQIAGGEI